MAATRIGWQVAAWALLVALQAWSLQRIAQLEAKLDGPRAGAPGKASAVVGDPPPSTPMEAAMAASLARIESRLAAGAGPSTAASATVQDPALAMPLAAADARLAALLPAGASLTDVQLAALQGRIDQLPAGERQAVALALARAINAGRVRVVP